MVCRGFLWTWHGLRHKNGAIASLSGYDWRGSSCAQTFAPGSSNAVSYLCGDYRGKYYSLHRNFDIGESNEKEISRRRTLEAYCSHSYSCVSAIGWCWQAYDSADNNWPQERSVTHQSIVCGEGWR